MSEPQPPQDTPPDRHHAGVWVFFIVFAIFALVILLPGFIDGLHNRITKRILLDKPGPVVNTFFWPSQKLSDAWPAYDHFYRWEFEAAGGTEWVKHNIQGLSIDFGPFTNY